MSLIHVPSHAVGGRHRARDGGLLGEALASLPQAKLASHTDIMDESAVLKMGRDMGLELRRVAGNVYEAPASRDYWAIRSGKLVRLTGDQTVVDDGEKLEPADIEDPEASLNRILADLEF